MADKFNCRRGRKRKQTNFNPDQGQLDQAIADFKKKGGKVEKLEPDDFPDGDPNFNSNIYNGPNTFNWG